MNDLRDKGRVMDIAGQRLRAQYDDAGIPRLELEHEVERIGDYAVGNAQPSDFCYNLINKDPSSCVYPVFEWIGRGRYRYLGLDYAYNGSVSWQPKGLPRRVVGQWTNGILDLWQDPRNR